MSRLNRIKDKGTPKNRSSKNFITKYRKTTINVVIIKVTMLYGMHETLKQLYSSVKSKYSGQQIRTTTFKDTLQLISQNVVSQGFPIQNIENKSSYPYSSQMFYSARGFNWASVNFYGHYNVYVCMLSVQSSMTLRILKIACVHCNVCNICPIKKAPFFFFFFYFYKNQMQLYKRQRRASL